MTENQQRATEVVRSMSPEHAYVDEYVEIYDGDAAPLVDAIAAALDEAEKRGRAEELQAIGRQQLMPARWWRVVAADGSLWCETGDKDEALAALRPGDRLRRQYRAEIVEWRDELPGAQP